MQPPEADNRRHIEQPKAGGEDDSGGDSLDLTVNLITRKGYNLNAKERLFKHMIMDSYRKEL